MRRIFREYCVELNGHSTYSLGRIEKHQSDRFIIIINPASGPGETKLPDTNWIREIIRLNKYKHVYCIGYIAVAYGKRPFDSVEGNIQKYARWADGGLMIQGIFVDEAPSMADEHNFRYIQDIEHAVWASSVLGTGKIGMYSSLSHLTEFAINTKVTNCTSLKSWNDCRSSPHCTR